MDTTKATKKNPARQWAFRAVTVLVSAAILYYCLRKVEWDRLREAAADADYLLAWAGMIVPALLFWVLDTAYTVKSFAWFHRPVRFRDYFVIKAAAYLLAMVNITFATGGVFFYFVRKTGITVRKQAGLLVWRSSMAVFACGIFFGALALYATVFDRPRVEEIGLGLWAPVIAAILLLMIDFALYSKGGGGLLLKNLPLSRQGEFMSPFRESRPYQWAAGGLYTLPAILAYSGGMYLVARAFSVNVPPLIFIFWIPLVSVISALPVAFSNFGTTTAAWTAVFSLYGTPAQIMALTLFIPASRLVVRLVIGAVFLAPAMREIDRLANEPTPTSSGEPPA